MVGEEGLRRLHRAGAVARRHRVAVHVGVLDHQVAAARHQPVPRLELGRHVVPGMVGVEDDHDALAGADPAAHVSDDRRIGAGAVDVADARMRGPAVALVDVDRDDAAAIEQVTERRQIGRAAAEARAALDDHVGRGLEQDLLVGPHVHRTFERVEPHPAQVDRAGAVGVVPQPVVELMERLDDAALVVPQGPMRADELIGAARLLGHGSSR